MYLRVYLTIMATAYFLWLGYYFFQACGERIDS